jgi:hypothetical protein
VSHLVYFLYYLDIVLVVDWFFFTGIIADFINTKTKGRFPIAVAFLAAFGVFVGYYVHWVLYLTLVLSSEEGKALKIKG